MKKVLLVGAIALFGAMNAQMEKGSWIVSGKTGIGIPDFKQDSVFRKFYRVEESSVQFQGMGIGLYICSEIIKQHHGTIGLSSKLEEGSTFYFTLPLN